MIKYNDDDIYVGEIKQLLKDFNLPKARIYNANEPLVEGLHYIKDNALYYCKVKKDANGNNIKVLDFIETYVYNESYGNLTTNFRITSNIYDSHTHRYLGKYLRFLKDYKDLDLMSMYNCFSNEQLKNVNLTLKGNNYAIKKYDSSTKSYVNVKIEINDNFLCNDDANNVYCIPVRFGQKYTIAVNCSLPISVIACFYKSGRIVDLKTNDDLYGHTYKCVRNCSLNKPYIYTNLYDYEVYDEQRRDEECLCLLMKVPIGCDSSIVVLEGDFSNSKRQILDKNNKLESCLFKYNQSHQHWENDEEHSGKSWETIDTSPTWYGKYNYVSKPELLEYSNSKGTNLLATRIKEYLSENAITNMSEGYDIKKVQKELIRRGYVDSDYLGVWSNNDRIGLYKFINDFNLNNDNLDVISYLDKDVEHKIGGIE